MKQTTLVRAIIVILVGATVVVGMKVLQKPNAVSLETRATQPQTNSISTSIAPHPTISEPQTLANAGPELSSQNSNTVETNAITQAAPVATRSAKVAKSPKNGQAASPKPGKEKFFKDPIARDALTLVGVDPDAEQYWFEAIHDPTLPKSERQDLIDDLNENGLADPKHPTLEEVPLILNRLEILEDLAPTLSSELDWKEAHDDLVNLVEVAMGGGKPVQ